MHNKKQYIYLGILAGTFLGPIGTLHATVTITEQEEIDIMAVAPYAQRDDSDAMWVSNGTLSLDKAKLGTAIKTTVTGAGAEGNAVPFCMDGDFKIYAASSITPGGAWRSFRSTVVPEDYSATTTLILTEILRDGVTPGGGTEYTIEVTFTKAGTGSPANLTRVAIERFLRGTTSRNLSTLTGTGITLTAGAGATLTVGWTATALMKTDAPAAVAAVLDDAEFGMTLPITEFGGTAKNFTTVLRTDLFNKAAASTTDVTASFASAAGKMVEFGIRPGTMATRTIPISTSLVTGVNTFTGRRLAITADLKTFRNTTTSALAKLKSVAITTDNDTLQAKLAAIPQANIEAAGYVIGDFTTTADTNNYGLVMVGNTNLTSVTWSSSTSKVIANGKVGATAAAEDFECDLTGLLIIKDDTNHVLKFQSKLGNVFYVKSFDGTGLDMTAENDYGAGYRDDLLAAALANKLTAVVTIAAEAVDAIN